MDIRNLHEFASNVANMCFANVEDKHRIRDLIIKYTASYCFEYHNNQNFKKQMDGLIELIRSGQYD